jgi:uncharacterized protein
MRAAQETGVRSPLREAGLTKETIRLYARQTGLPNWDKPSLPCLATRIPYGQPVTSPKLRQVAEAEEILCALGLPRTRVRHHGRLASIEVPEPDLDLCITLDLRQIILREFSRLGFTYVCLDLKGLRSGSMNELLTKKGAEN